MSHRRRVSQQRQALLFGPVYDPRVFRYAPSDYCSTLFIHQPCCHEDRFERGVGLDLQSHEIPSKDRAIH